MQKQINKKLNEQVLNGLSGKFEVIGKPRIYQEESITLQADFIFHGKTGTFDYTLEGSERGIDKVKDFIEEKEDEDIYEEIHAWMNEHINWSTKVWMDEKEIQ